MKYRVYIMLTLLLSVLLLLSGCSLVEKVSKGPLKVGVRSDIVDFGYLDRDSGILYGFEIDLANELATRMGYNGCEFVTVTADDREQILQSGKADCLIACVTITEERKETMNFSGPYYENIPVIMTEKSSLIDDFRKLNGSLVGFISGANTANYLTERMEASGYHVDFKDFPSYQMMADALEVGRIDAACFDKAISVGYMSDERQLIDMGIEPQYYGIATRKNAKLSQEIDLALESMREDGLLEAMQKEWE